MVMRILLRSLTIVLERAAGRCEMCGDPGTNTHHRAGRGMGGSKDPRLGLPSNLLRLSGSGSTGCHGWVTNHPAAAYDLGLLVRRGQDPAKVPVHLFIPDVFGWPPAGWVLLTNDGRYVPVEENVA